MIDEKPSIYEDLKQGLEEVIEWARSGMEGRLEELRILAPEYTAEDVKRIREQRNMSQGKFAFLLNVSMKTVQSWEQGKRKPSHSSARLLQIIETPDALPEMIASVRSVKHIKRDGIVAANQVSETSSSYSVGKPSEKKR